MTNFTTYDAADYLKSESASQAYLDEALKLGDPAGVKQALGNIARAQNMQKVAERAGMKRESLSRAVSAQGNPELETLFRITKALGVQLGVRRLDSPMKSGKSRVAVASPKAARSFQSSRVSVAAKPVMQAASAKKAAKKTSVRRAGTRRSAAR